MSKSFCAAAKGLVGKVDKPPLEPPGQAARLRLASKIVDSHYGLLSPPDEL